MLQYILRALPPPGLQGSTEIVEASGKRKRSDSFTFMKPFTADASKEIPYLNALGSSSAIIAIFFSVPNMSQKARRTNFISFSSANCRTSLMVVSMAFPF